MQTARPLSCPSAKEHFPHRRETIFGTAAFFISENVRHTAADYLQMWAKIYCSASFAC